ncbi:hypothetical protein NDU88_012670 [Pleurodeles waltl]|uniref:Peptidase A2 domain-containing protein n=1 Tax=Pleurodeles waltl TaxID=8319 RepID=A0AAV7R239_PLEWA|nr:hypothetical protein NDU88_012670 [Pleurodeles waltl]
MADPSPHDTRAQASWGLFEGSLEDDEEEEAFLISYNENPKRHRKPQPTCEIDIEGSTVTALIDTGASVIVMGIQQYRRLQPRLPLVNSKTRIFTYGSSTPLPLKGKMSVTVKTGCREIQATFHVIATEADILLSSHFAEDLGLVPLHSE